MSDPATRTVEELDKFKAEAERARAEAEAARANARKAHAEAAAAEDAAVKSRYEREREDLKRDKELAGDEYRRIYRFVGQVSDSSVKTAISTLRKWSRLDADRDGATYTIELFSPGGDVIAGLALYDFVTAELKPLGIKIVTRAFGMAASMGSILLQMGDEREVSPSCSFLIHEISAGAIGSWGDIKDRVKWLEVLQDRLFDILAERSKLSRRQIRNRADRTDWWMLGEEIVKLGFADRVA